MTSAYVASALACILFSGAMIHVIVTDLRSRLIRNWVIVALALAYLPLALGAGLSWADMAGGLAAGVLIFAAGFGCFAAGWVGGGDVKLAAVSGLWLGAHQSLLYILVASLAGAALAVLMLAADRLSRRHAAPGAQTNVSARELPYGPALAVAGLALLHNSPWAGAL